MTVAGLRSGSAATPISKKARKPKKRGLGGWGSLASTLHTRSVVPGPPSDGLRERYDHVIKENRAIQLKLLQKEAELLLMDPLKLESLEGELEERDLHARLTELAARTAAVEDRGVAADRRHGHNVERARRAIQGDTVRYQRAVIRDRELKADMEKHRRELGVVRSEWFSERDVRTMQCADMERKIAEKMTASERSKARLKKQGALRETYGAQIDALKRENAEIKAVIAEAHGYVDDKLLAVHDIAELHRARERPGGKKIYATRLQHERSRTVSTESFRCLKRTAERKQSVQKSAETTSM